MQSQSINQSALSYQYSLSSSQANVSHISLRDRGQEAPKELYGFIYDIPKDAGLTNDDLMGIFRDDFHLDCQI